MSGKSEIAEQVFVLEHNLGKQLEEELFFGPDTAITHVYNPISYAQIPHRAFLQKYMDGTKRVLFLGMNPGPWGMAQSGVPFGQVDIVRNWLGVDGHVEKPSNEHPKRPITGLSCKRREVSGERLWGLVREVCGSPEPFFQSCAVYNHCPLLFLTKSGKNVTPADMKASQKNVILRACDDALLKVMLLLEVKVVVGVGRFAQVRAQKVVKGNGLDVEVCFMNHPSPASASANKTGWKEIARRQLSDMGVLQMMMPEG